MCRSDLVRDCGKCEALCCVVTSFEASEDFAFDKPAGVPCRFVTPDCRCAIHDQLLERGLGGCAAYDCHGAGQRATRVFHGAALDDSARIEGFLALQSIHEQLWLLTEAVKLLPSGRLSPRNEIEFVCGALESAAASIDLGIPPIDLQPLRSLTRVLLRRVGGELSASEPPDEAD